MKDLQKQNISQSIVQAVLWLLVLSIPVGGVRFAGGSWHDGFMCLYQSLPNYVMWMGCFYINYLVYIPRFYQKRKFLIYFVLLFATYIVMGNVNSSLYMLITGREWSGTGNDGLDFVVTISQYLLNMLLCIAAIAFRTQQQYRILQSKVSEMDAAVGNGTVPSVVEAPSITEPAAMPSAPMSAVPSAMDVANASSASDEQPQPEESSFMFVKCEARQVRVNFDDILYISALKDYVRIHLQSQPRPLIALSTMKAMESKLPKSRFCRVHRSHIVAMDKIESVEHNRIAIRGVLIPVSESYQEIFSERLG